MDQPSYAETLQRIYQSLGRLEQKIVGVDEKVDDVKSQAAANMRERDARFDQIIQRQVSDAHETRNTQQVMMGKIEGVQKQVDKVEVKVVSIEDRTGKLEAPVKKALAIRAQRAKALGRVVAISAAIASGMWLFIQPIWNLVATPIAKAIMDHLGGGG